MKRFFSLFFEYLKSSDSFLLLLCTVSSVFGVVLISSATRDSGSGSYIFTQVFALFLGICCYFIFSIIDVDTIAEKWKLLFAASVILIAALFVFGVGDETVGNRAWIRFGGFGIQPSEISKIAFIIVLAKVMAHLEKNRGLSNWLSVLILVTIFAVYFALIIVASSDLGSALVYLFIFVMMLFIGGLKFYWFLLGAGIVAAVSPYLWNHFLSDYQRQRILAPYDPSIDPTGQGITWQVNQSKTAIAAGRIFGQGLYSGARTHSGYIPKQHTDFIFSVAGEELGLIGCTLIILLLLAIVIRCIYVGMRSRNRIGALVCIGVAAMIIFQMFENIGMCIGIAPVIGLTLPFFSYGGSSILTLFIAMGIVSGVKLHHSPQNYPR